MDARDGAPAVVGTTANVHGQRGGGIYGGRNDAASGERRPSWDPRKTESIRQMGTDPGYPLDPLGTTRLRIDRGLGLARTWRGRMKEFGDRQYQKLIIQGLLRRKPLPPSKDGRHIPLDAGAVRNEPLIDERSGKHYKSNSIRSNRYTLLSFLPKQVIFQFGRLANFYFLVIGILQQIPGWSPTGRFTTLGPLLAFIALIMAKEGWDDYRRYLLDREDNLAFVSVIGTGRASAAEQTLGSPGRFIRRLQEKRTQANEGPPTSEPVSERGGETRWIRMKWRDLRVGDIIRLERNERVPADIALLHATGVNSVAYIDTMALDGETNLKSKQPSSLVANRCDTISKLERCTGELVCEDPNADLYQFEGRITINDETVPLTLNEVVFRGSTIRNTQETIGIVINTGEECKIRMNANQYVHTKSPKINRFTNRIVISLVIILLAITAGVSGGYVLWQQQYERKNPFLAPVPVSAPAIIVGTVILINALIPLSLYIVIEFVKVLQAYHLNDIEMYDAATDTPISINTNTILEDLGQVNYIFSDKTGTLTENNMQFRKISVGGTSWLHTMNMTTEEAKEALHKGNEESSTPIDPKTADASSVEAALPAPGPVGTSSSNATSGTEHMLEYIHQHPDTEFSKQARQFLLCIALCHTCLPETSPDGKITFQAASPDEVALVQAAQDLGYLMIDRPAQAIRLRVSGGTGSPVTETYEILQVIEFSSSRKRMSVVVRVPDGRICVVCKGADNVIMSRLRLADLASRTAGEVDRRARERHSVEAERALQRRLSAATPRTSHHGRRPSFLRSSHSARTSRDLKRMSSGRQEDGEAAAHALPDEKSTYHHKHHHSDDNGDDDDAAADRDGVIDEAVASDEARVFRRCFKHVDDYATEGLRTLLYGYRYVGAAEHAAWEAGFRAAAASLADRRGRTEAAAEALERGLELAGATAIEDRLQGGVPATVDALRRAGVRLWMLTGDKRETAVNIARSADLAKPFSEIYVLDAANAAATATSSPGGGEEEELREELREVMRGVFADVARGLVPHAVLVVDGRALGVIEGDAGAGGLREMFFELAVRVDSVICCRASPNQKATLVRGVRDADPGCVTLAIGDGANDIAMIQASHVGIGISGREGLQAARVADYGIAQFRFLQRLLLVHGHWLYLRTSKYILCTFWKEWVFYIVQAQFQGFTGYSGTSLYQPWALTAYNAAFTSLPIFFLGLCEQDLSPETLLAVPELYSFGQRDEGINMKKCVAWLVSGTVDTVVVFLVVWAEFTYNLTGFSAIRDSSHDNSLYPMGSLALTIVIVLINVKILILEMHNKTWPPLAACALSIALWFLFLVVVDALPGRYSAGSWYRVRGGLAATFGPSVAWWAVAVIGIALVVGANLGATAVQRVFFPTDRNLWQEMEKKRGAVEGARPPLGGLGVGEGEEEGEGPHAHGAGIENAPTPQPAAEPLRR